MKTGRGEATGPVCVDQGMPGRRIPWNPRDRKLKTGLKTAMPLFLRTPKLSIWALLLRPHSLKGIPKTGVKK